jgi:hypothetical protein
MKQLKYLLVILVIGALISCKEEPKQKNSDLPAAAKEPVTVSLSTYRGFWLSEDYVNKIKELKSVDTATFAYKAMALAIEIFPDTISNKSVEASILWHSETSYIGRLIFNSDKKLSYTPKPDEDVYEPFTITLKGTNRIEVIRTRSGKKEYYLCFKNGGQVLNQLLFAGTYNDVKSRKKITFSIDGKVTGIPNAGFYSPVFQFDESNYEGIDVLFFYKDKNRKRPENNNDSFAYQYKFKGDTLQLYVPPLNFENDTIPVLKYELIKY